MGSVSDFKAAEEQEFAGGATAAPKQEAKANYYKNKRLVRDAQRKILGGVCRSRTLLQYGSLYGPGYCTPHHWYFRDISDCLCGDVDCTARRAVRR